MTRKRLIAIVFSAAFLSGMAAAAQRMYVGVDVFRKRETMSHNDPGGYIVKNDPGPNYLYLFYGINFGYQLAPRLTLETGLYRNTLANRVNFNFDPLRSYSQAERATQIPLRAKWLLFVWGNRDRYRLEALGGLSFSRVNRRVGPITGWGGKGFTTGAFMFDSEYSHSLVRRNFWSGELGGSLSREFGKRRRMMLMVAYTYQWGLSGTVKRTDVRYQIMNDNYTATINANGGGHFYTVGLKYLIRKEAASDTPTGR